MAYKPEEVEDDSHKEKETYFTPQVISDGSCVHYYVDAGVDDEGYPNVQCSKCWFGRRYDPKEFKLEDGKVVDK
jgi:hypothetical protein